MRFATTGLLLAALAAGGAGCETEMTVPGDTEDPPIPDAMQTPWEDAEQEGISPDPAAPADGNSGANFPADGASDPPPANSLPLNND